MHAALPPHSFVALFGPLALTACISVGPRMESSESIPDSPLSRYLDVGGIATHLLDTANVRPDPGYAAPLFLVHGWMGSSHDFEPLIEMLPAKLRAIAPDLPGSGRSQKLGIDYSLDFFLEFLRDSMDKLGLRTVVLVGHSFGGMLAVQFTHRYPERVERLVLIDPDGLSGEEEQWRLLRTRPFFVDLFAALNSRMAVEIGLRTNVFFDPAFVTPARIDAVAETALTREGRWAQAQITSNVLGRFTVDDLLPEISQRVLIIWGEKDRLLRPSWGARYVQLTPRSELVLIPACGHLPQVEAPAATATALLSFLAE